MTTLQSIGYTLSGGLGFAAISIGCFGTAVMCRSTYIAPRCAARPPEVIYNPSAKPGTPQYRGNPFVGWIRWANALTYDTLLRGVPGTGTRNSGLEGIMLRVNLDGIVLLRFQALCLKISLFVAIICVVVILPLNLTGHCTFSEKPGDEPQCFEKQQSNTTTARYNSNLTNYELTTLANIPDLLQNQTDIWDHVFTLDKAGSLGRLYGISLCTWLIAYYVCKHSYQEWKTLLALRRVYYLEKDHWAERRKELENSLLLSQREEDPSSPLIKRDPWIPHPEQRETVVNVGLYSVLVGGLPSAPDEEIDRDDVEALVDEADKMKLDWQLEFATKYFDSCVPNPPGYSSSVAAITILPSASDLANAWGKWYAAASSLRRLRFIREIIQEKVYYDIPDEDEDDDREVDEEEKLDVLERDIASSERQSTERMSSTRKASILRKKSIDKAIWNTAKNRDYYQTVLGVDDGAEFMSYDFGPEQTAVYSREFAQGAANCCPTGCFTDRVRRATIDELREMEKEAILKVHQANLVLDEAQLRAIKDRQRLVSSPSQNMKSQDDDDEKFHDAKQDAPVDLQNASLVVMMASKLRGRGWKRRKEDQQLESSESSDWKIFESIMRNSVVHGSIRTNPESAWHYEKRIWSLAKRLKGHTSKSVEFAYEQGAQVSSEVGAELQSFAGEVHNTVANHLVRETTYAVVTFTSRQAAVAARQCLADGRGTNRWVTLSDIPYPPLADAAAFNIFFCRGCCRPVSLSIHQRQKAARHHLAMLLLFVIYVFYTVPLNLTTSLLDPDKIDTVIPGYSNWAQNSGLIGQIFAGLLPGLIFTLFFSLCPVMFKSIANFGSNATSVFKAEYAAMQYFWWFYVVTAIWGNSLSTIVTTGLAERSFTEETFRVIRQIANTIPTVISATWLNWIIVRSTIILPLHFLLQMNTFLFRIIGWNCCSRATRGGGPGGTTPYRLYIDDGLVLLCSVALAPASPLVSVAAYLYFLWSAPLLKRNLVFIYRPNLDAGGARWPFLFEMLIISLSCGQILMTAMMALKKAYGPAFFAAVPFIPTLLFRNATFQTFRRAYEDASLFHTSELDGLDIDEETFPELREAFRRFLVDAHKAAYVPVCLARSKKRESHIEKSSYVFTAEPAIVVPHANDIMIEDDSPRAFFRNSRARVSSSLSSDITPQHQFGVSMRRIPNAEKQRLLRERDVTVNDDGSVSAAVASTPRSKES